MMRGYKNPNNKLPHKMAFWIEQKYNRIEKKKPTKRTCRVGDISISDNRAKMNF